MHQARHTHRSHLPRIFVALAAALALCCLVVLPGCGPDDAAGSAAGSEPADAAIAAGSSADSGAAGAAAGQGNEQILKNIIRAGELGKKLVIRTPIVPDYNADEDNIRAIGRFLAENVRGNVVQYQLLPYRKMGTEKYASIGKPYPLEDYQAPERSQWEANLLHLAELLREEFGLPAVAGSSAKIEL